MTSRKPLSNLTIGLAILAIAILVYGTGAWVLLCLPKEIMR